jgi:hypothetical protein
MVDRTAAGGSVPDESARDGGDGMSLDLSSVAERISKAGLQMTVETDCLAGVVGLEPANPSASYLIGIA